ncbi:MAG: PaaI family thioesterase [Acidimicrobiia bacterium]
MTREPDPFQNDPDPNARGGPAFHHYIAALRRVQTLVASTNPPQEVLVEATHQLHAIERLLHDWVVDERDAPAGKRSDLPGRGHSLLLPFVVDEDTATYIRGRVHFDRFYLGGNGAAHGGTVPLLFDDVLGRWSNSHGRPVARTAYLHVNYRHITPIGPELTIDARLEREEGRKRYITGRLFHGDTLVADAEGLFVTLLPGQP